MHVIKLMGNPYLVLPNTHIFQCRASTNYYCSTPFNFSQAIPTIA